MNIYQTTVVYFLINYYYYGGALSIIYNITQNTRSAKITRRSKGPPKGLSNFKVQLRIGRGSFDQSRRSRLRKKLRNDGL